MRAVFIALAATSVLASPASAATIVNGSFENGIDPGTFTPIGGGNSTSIIGWTVGGDSVDYIGSYWQAAAGMRSIDLAGNNVGSIFQSLATVVGQAYRVTFSVARNPDAGANPRTGFVDVGGAQTLVSFNNPGSSTTNMAWQTRTYDFVASSALTSLRFSADPATSGTAYGLALDNVGIAAVPEPATWAMIILGFGLVGGAMRRRANPAFATA